MKANRKSRRSAFTLIEVLLVLVILTILVSMSVVGIRGARRRAQIDAARTQIGLFDSAVRMYDAGVNSFPATQQGLEALRSAPADAAGWSGPYLTTDIPADPWGQPYQYELSSDGETYRIWSTGPDKVDGTEDDITSS